MKQNTKSNVLLILLAIILISCAFVLTISIQNSESNEVYADSTHIHNGITFTAWTTNNRLPTTAGNYYLANDVTLSDDWTIPAGTINLCLNNHVITMGGKIYINTGRTLNIYDDGTTSHYYTGYYYQSKSYFGQVVNQSTYNSFTGNKGTFSGGYIRKDPSNTGFSCLIYLGGGEFNLHSGTIMGVASGIESRGGTINISGGNFLGSANAIWNSVNDITTTISVSGGTFSGNGGVISRSGGEIILYLSGGRFEKNRSTAINATNYYISGAPYVKESTEGYGVFLGNDRVLHLTAPLTEGAWMDIFANGVFTDGWTTYMGNADPTDYFTPSPKWQTDTILEMEGQEVAVKKICNITYDANGATSGDVPDSVTNVLSGTSITIADNVGNLQKSDCTFGGWNTMANGNGSTYQPGDSFEVAQNTTLYALWKEENPITYIAAQNIEATYSTISQTTAIAEAENNEGDVTYTIQSQKDSSNNDVDYFTIDGTTITISANAPVDDYTVIVRATAAGNNHYIEGYQESSVTLGITKANPTYEVPTGIRALKGKTLSYVALPNGWAWEDSTINVGDIEQDTTFKAQFTPADTSNYNVVTDIDIPVSVYAHEHSFAYQANGAIITAECENADCPITSGLTLTLNAPEGGLVYDGSAKAAIIADGYDLEAFVSPVIKYYKGNEEVSADAVKTAGNYKATVTIEQATAQVSFEILKADPTYTLPTGLQATYGDLLSSVVLPDGWAWKKASNTVGNAGDRECEAIFIPEDIENYNIVTINLAIEVAKATPTYTTPTNIEAAYGVSISSIVLPDGFSWMDGTQEVNNWGENTFKAKYTPSDTANYNMVENIDVKVIAKWILVDPTQDEINVVIDDGETQFDVSIKVKVEVKTELSVEAKHANYANLAKGFVAKDEDISAIYGVKLIRTTNGVEEEIQPSDIKEGQKIQISMAIPEELQGKEFRLLHIHNEGDILEIGKEDYTITEDGKTLIIEVDKLSEFAFVGKTDKADNGFVYEDSNNSKILWTFVAIAAVIVVCSLILLIIKRKKDDDEEKSEPAKVEDNPIDQ